MSFAQEIKEELMEQAAPARHCQLAELAALISAGGYVDVRPTGHVILAWESENPLVARRAGMLVRRAFRLTPESGISVSGEHRRSRVFLTAVTDSAQACRILMAVKYMTQGGVLRELTLPPHEILFRSACCRRAFLRGSFLAAGSVSDPRKSYHLEFVCPDGEKAEQIRRMIGTFDIDAKVVQRKDSWVVYIKESEAIADMISLMGATRGRMDMENIRILRNISGKVNRSVNCETANLNKTVTAAVEQIRAIEKIRDTAGLSSLPPQLQEMAEVRLENPDVPLKDLGALLDPPVGKSGVNHRLRRLREIAEELELQ